MRLLIAALALLATVSPAGAKSEKSQCKDRCQVQYKFCLNRATTKRGKSLCKVERKTCKSTCR